MYHRFLNRSATAIEINNWLFARVAGLTNEDIFAALAIYPDFYIVFHYYLPEVNHWFPLFITTGSNSRSAVGCQTAAQNPAEMN